MLPPSPTPSASSSPASSTQQLTIGSAPQTATFATIQSGYSGSVVLPPAATAASVTLTLSGSAPSGTPTVMSAHRVRAVLGEDPSALAFVSSTSSGTVTFLSSPQFTFTLPSTPQSGTLFALALYDPTNPSAGWQLFAGPVSASGTTVTFASTSGITLNAGVVYAFALYTSATLTPPTPIPSPGMIEFVLQGGVGASTSMAGSATLTVNGVPLPQQPVDASGGTITLVTPAGTNESLQLALFARDDSGGTPFALASTQQTVVAGQTVTATVTLVPVMIAFSLTLNPAIATTGTAGDIQINVIPQDPLGNTILTTPYVNVSGTTPPFTASVADPSGETQITQNPAPGTPGILHYAGTGSGPATVKVVSGTTASTISLHYLPAHEVFALEQTGTVQFPAVPPFVQYFNAGGTLPVWSENLPAAAYGPIAFDASGNVWADDPKNYTLIGFHTDGTSAGTIALPNAPETLLAFDTGGNLYTATGANVYEYSVGAQLNLTLLRTITPTSQACAAAVDAHGTLYVATCGSSSQTAAVYAYPSGNTNYSGYVFGTFPSVGVDAAGDLFGGTYTNNVVEWAGGTFGGNPVNLPIAAQLIAVQPSGDICGIQETNRFEDTLVSWSPLGSIPVCPAPSEFTPSNSYYFFGYLAAPIR